MEQPPPNAANQSWIGWLVNLPWTLMGYVWPSEIMDASLATTKFIAELETKYGQQHPNFIRGSYTQACNSAKSNFKFLIVYVHSPFHVDTPNFCRNVLCTSTIAEFFDEHFVSWGGSVTSPEGYKVSHSLGCSSFPFIAVICNNNIGTMTVLDRIEGFISTEDLMARLATVLATNGHILVAARADHQEREMARNLREEQDQAFLQALKEDQEREKKREEEERRVREEREREEREEEMKRQKEQEKAKRKAELLRKTDLVPPEPTPGEKGITSLVVRLPDGSRLQRRFRGTDTIQSVINYIDSAGHVDEEYELLTNFPRKVFNNFSMTLDEAGLCPQASLFVQTK